jgi:hypothetical protein
MLRAAGLIVGAGRGNRIRTGTYNQQLTERGRLNSAAKAVVFRLFGLQVDYRSFGIAIGVSDKVCDPSRKENTGS